MNRMYAVDVDAPSNAISQNHCKSFSMLIHGPESVVSRVSNQQKTYPFDASEV